ncbi:hypothetical protein J5X91_17775 [Pseudoalteromonas sp. K222D]|uniref:hypothetical protein n=1 Tax=Pseudoalteromonas sp. K222D TaxID=2820756 RepID=UPI001AD7CE44|nr:hypothetical protein [Pseudoalteromonas sp. K222D]MBO7928086.1 hypothetical protein [Pseudoalteromonas sp. K222D]
MMLEPLLKSFIRMSNINNFTVLEALAGYIALSKSQMISVTYVKKNIELQLYDLVKKDLLLISENQRGVVFSKTELFCSAYPFKVAEEDMRDSFISECRNQLRNFKTDLLECCHILDTYDDIWKLQPKIKDELLLSYSAINTKIEKLEKHIYTLNKVIENYNSETT